MISEQQEFIIRLFKEYLNIDIDESNFKCHRNGDLAVYFYFRGRNLFIWYNDYFNRFELMHRNEFGNPKQGHRYHLQWHAATLTALIGGYLVNMHDAKNMNQKKSRMDELFDKIK